MTTVRRHTQSSTTTETPPRPPITWVKPYESAVDVAVLGTAEWAQFSEPSAFTGADVDSTTQEDHYYGSPGSAQESISLFSGDNRGNRDIVVKDKHFSHLWATLQSPPAPRISAWEQLRTLAEVFRSQEVVQYTNLFPTNVFLSYEDWSGTLLYNKNLEELKRQIRQLLEVAGEDDWDGDGAQAISIETLEVAEDIAKVFPQGVDAPEISATPHGEVDFDWIISSKTMMTVSACPSKEIAFAAIFENARVRDRQAWNGRLPPLLGTCFKMLRAGLEEAGR